VPIDFLARVKSGMLLIVVFLCLLSSYRLLKQAREMKPQVVYEQRFDDVRKILPAHGTVGYFSDVPADVGRYYLTQYALAPLVVENSTNHYFVVGNLSDARSPIPMNRDWVLVRNFGNGVVLLENRGK
jgi:hypothetical protein